MKTATDEAGTPSPVQGDPIRVLHVCGALAGGVGSVLMGYYRHIDRSAVQFDFLTHSEPDPDVRTEVESLGGTINVVTPKTRGFMKNIAETKGLINRRTPHQVVHVHTASPTSFIYLLIAWIAGKRVRVAHSHATSLETPPGSWQFRLHCALRPLLRWTATDHFACSVAAGHWLFGDDDEIRVIPNAIDTERFKFDLAARERVRLELGIEDRLVVGHVGRFVDAKNHRFLVDVFAAFVRLEPQAVLLLVGDGPLENDVRRAVGNAGLEGKVHFLGNRLDVPELLSAMDLFILPSNFEGLPLVLVESQALGLPSLTSTEVTREIALSDCVAFESLATAPGSWAERALGMTVAPSERLMSDEIAKAGYDITSAARSLAEFYRSEGRSSGGVCDLAYCLTKDSKCDCAQEARNLVRLLPASNKDRLSSSGP